MSLENNYVKLKRERDEHFYSLCNDWCFKRFATTHEEEMNDLLKKIQSNYKTMLSYCLKCRKNTESKNPKVVKTKNGRMMQLSNSAVCDSKKSRFIIEEEASGLLYRSNSQFSRIPLIDNVLWRYKMNEIVNMFLLAGDNLCPKCI